jgi:hypothetical protein
MSEEQLLDNYLERKLSGPPADPAERLDHYRLGTPKR